MADSMREVVRVTAHANGGFTRVLVESMEGQGQADGRVEWEIPTELIPSHLRNIGSRFVVKVKLPQRQGREHIYDGIVVEELEVDDRRGTDREEKLEEKLGTDGTYPSFPRPLWEWIRNHKQKIRRHSASTEFRSVSLRKWLNSHACCA